MLSTITAATIEAVSGRAGSAALVPAASLVVALTFLVLLIEREAIGDRAARKPRSLARGLNVAFVPLACAFALVVAAALLQVLGS